MFKEQLTKDLKTINNLIKNNKDSMLNYFYEKDKNLILSEIGKECFNEFNELNSELIEVILTNQPVCSPLNKIKLINKKNNKDIFGLFYCFIEKDKFGLKDLYEKIMSYNGIEINFNKISYYGGTFYIESLDKNYIFVNFSKNELEGYSVLIHELGHAFQNHNSRLKKKQYSNFSETFSFFLELIFLEFLQKNNLVIEPFNLKCQFLNNTIKNSKYLYDCLSKEQYYGFDKIVLHNFIGNLLAFYFYDLYLTNEKECINKLKIFNSNIGVVDDLELLKSINLDFEDFKNLKLISQFNNDLKKERQKIKQK